MLQQLMKSSHLSRQVPPYHHPQQWHKHGSKKWKGHAVVSKKVRRETGNSCSPWEPVVKRIIHCTYTMHPRFHTSWTGENNTYWISCKGSSVTQYLSETAHTSLVCTACLWCCFPFQSPFSAFSHLLITSESWPFLPAATSSQKYFLWKCFTCRQNQPSAALFIYSQPNCSIKQLKKNFPCQCQSVSTTVDRTLG